MASLFGTLVLLAVAILATEALQLPVRRTTGSSVNFATHRFCRLTYRKSSTTLGASSKPSADTKTATKNNKASGKAVSSDAEEEKGPSAFDQVASKGLAGVLAIAAAEAIFWAAGMPLAALWVRFTTGEWIDLMSTEGQLQAAGKHQTLLCQLP